MLHFSNKKLILSLIPCCATRMWCFFLRKFVINLRIKVMQIIIYPILHDEMQRLISNSNGEKIVKLGLPVTLVVISAGQLKHVYLLPSSSFSWSNVLKWFIISLVVVYFSFTFFVFLNIKPCSHICNWLLVFYHVVTWLLKIFNNPLHCFSMVFA